MKEKNGDKCTLNTDTKEGEGYYHLACFFRVARYNAHKKSFPYDHMCTEVNYCKYQKKD